MLPAFSLKPKNCIQKHIHTIPDQAIYFLMSFVVNMYVSIIGYVVLSSLTTIILSSVTWFNLTFTWENTSYVTESGWFQILFILTAFTTYSILIPYPERHIPSDTCGSIYLSIRWVINVECYLSIYLLKFGYCSQGTTLSLSVSEVQLINSHL